MTAKALPAGTLGRLLALRSVAALQDLNLLQAAALSHLCKEASFRKGQSVQMEIDGLDAAIILVRGSATVEREGFAAESAGSLETVGLLSLLARRAVGPAVRFSEDTMALTLTYEDLEDLCERHFGVLSSLLGFISIRALEEMAALTSGTWLGEQVKAPSPVASDSLDLVERMSALAGSPAFPATQMDAISELARQATEMRLPAEQQLWGPGDAGDYFLLVVSGAVRCETGAGWHCHGGAGTTVGEFEALAGLDRRFMAVAHEPTVALRIDVDAFLDVLEDHFAMAMAFLRVTAEGLLEVTHRDAPPEPS